MGGRNNITWFILPDEVNKRGGDRGAWGTQTRRGFSPSRHCSEWSISFLIVSSSSRGRVGEEGGLKIPSWRGQERQRRDKGRERKRNETKTKPDPTLIFSFSNWKILSCLSMHFHEWERDGTRNGSPDGGLAQMKEPEKQMHCPL